MYFNFKHALVSGVACQWSGSGGVWLVICGVCGCIVDYDTVIDLMTFSVLVTVCSFFSFY